MFIELKHKYQVPETGPGTLAALSRVTTTCHTRGFNLSTAHAQMIATGPTPGGSTASISELTTIQSYDTCVGNWSTHTTHVYE